MGHIQQHWDGEYLQDGRRPADDPWFLPLLPPPPLTVLDAGCGDGSDAAVLSREGYGVVGFDASPAGVGLARERVPSGVFSVASVLSPGNAAALGPFGAVLADLCLHYFRWDETVAALTALAALAGPDAPLLLRVNSTLDTGFGYGAGEEVEPGLFQDPQSGMRKRFFDAEGLGRLVRASGCRADVLRPATTLRYGGREKHVLECRCFRAST